jgi:hypothetical protein
MGQRELFAAVFSRLSDRATWTRRPSTGSMMQAFFFVTMFALRFTFGLLVAVHLGLLLMLVVGLSWSLRKIDQENDLRRNREAKAKRFVASTADRVATVLRNGLVAVLVYLGVTSANVITDAISLMTIGTALSSEALLGWLTHSLAKAVGIPSADDTADEGARATPGGATKAGAKGPTASRPYTVIDDGPLSGVVRRGCLL